MRWLIALVVVAGTLAVSGSLLYVPVRAGFAVDIDPPARARMTADAQMNLEHWTASENDAAALDWSSKLAALNGSWEPYERQWPPRFRWIWALRQEPPKRVGFAVAAYTDEERVWWSVVAAEVALVLAIVGSVLLPWRSRRKRRRAAK